MIMVSVLGKPVGPFGVDGRGSPSRLNDGPNQKSEGGRYSAFLKSIFTYSLLTIKLAISDRGTKLLELHPRKMPPKQDLNRSGWESTDMPSGESQKNGLAFLC